MEEWRDIAGYEGLYQVSNMGRVRSLDRVVECVDSIRCYKGRMIKPVTQNNGYLCVGLCNAGDFKRYFIHRLVANAFLTNDHNYPDVNHKDENKTNNVPSNLEWCDKTYNNNYGTRKQRANDAQHRKTVLQYDLNGGFIKEYSSVSDAARAIGKPNDVGSITKCCNGRLKRSHGYIWRFKEVT